MLSDYQDGSANHKERFNEIKWDAHNLKQIYLEVFSTNIISLQVVEDVSILWMESRMWIGVMSLKTALSAPSVLSRPTVREVLFLYVVVSAKAVSVSLIWEMYSI